MVGSLILPGWLDRNCLRFGEYGLIVDTKKENMSFIKVQVFYSFFFFFVLESSFILECVSGILGRFLGHWFYVLTGGFWRICAKHFTITSPFMKRIPTRMTQ